MAIICSNAGQVKHRCSACLDARPWRPTWKSWYPVNFCCINRSVYFDSDNCLSIFYFTLKPQGQNTHHYQKPCLMIIAQLTLGK
ncbi:hypothetical protein IMY05_014G0063500 [Salix suchowensis]|nr:hypothetical protein IMY05_014G0063500 [Salix suchowensis]